MIELDGQIIGQNMFMQDEIKADDGRTIPIMTMGPICIAPELKRNWSFQGSFSKRKTRIDGGEVITTLLEI